MGANDERSKSDRRAFLQQCGRFAVVTPPVVSLMLSVSEKAGAATLATSGAKHTTTKTTTTLTSITSTVQCNTLTLCASSSETLSCFPTIECTTVFPSDIRLKEDILPLMRFDNGIGLYRYRYNWSDQFYVGVMAQEVATIVPTAVLRGKDGYLRVDYGQLGMKLMTWDDWTAGKLPEFLGAST